MELKGTPVEATSPIELAAGWTWLGYLPTDAKPINEALASLEDSAQDGDVIVSRDAFAHYVEDAGWVGSLTALRPGEGYQIKLSEGGTLAYPSSAPVPLVSGRLLNEPDVQNLHASAEAEPGDVKTKTVASEKSAQEIADHAKNGPDWRVIKAQHPTAMTLVAEVIHDGAALQDSTSKVAVFAGDELRGTGTLRYVEALDRHLAFVLIHGDVDENQALEVRVYDGEADALHADVETFDYTAHTALGQPGEPVALDLTPAAKAAAELPTEFALSPNYPNPFNPTTTIQYALPEAVDVRLVIYNVLGQKVVTLVKSPQEAGRYEVVFEASRLASGLYFYRIEAGDFVQVRKMMLLR